MRRATVSFVVIVFALGLAAPLLGGSMNILAVGATAKGMGGAFRAISDDWSAGYYNPAGLFYATDNRIYFNELITYTGLKYTPNVKQGDYNIGFYDGEIYNNYKILTNPMAGGHTRMQFAGRDVAVGFAFFQPYDINISWNVFQSLNNDASLPLNQIENNFDAVAFNFVGAVEIMENKLSFGISAGLLKADLIYGGFFLRPNPFDPAPNTTESFYINDLTSRPNDLITEWQKVDGNGYAPNIRLGLMFKPTPRFNIGASYAHKVSVSIKGGHDILLYMPSIPNFNSRYDIKDDHESAEYLLSSGISYSSYGDFEADIDLPGQFGLGISYLLNEKLRLAADLEYTLWSQFGGYRLRYTFYKDNIIPNEELNDWMKYNMSLPVNWRDTWRISLGANYDYSDVVKLRCGYTADQSPYEDGSNQENIAFFDSGMKNAISAGLGLHFENISLDFATQYIKYPKNEFTGDAYLEVFGSTDGIRDNTPGTYDGSMWESIVEFSFRF